MQIGHPANNGTARQRGERIDEIVGAIALSYAGGKMLHSRRIRSGRRRCRHAAAVQIRKGRVQFASRRYRTQTLGLYL